MRRRNFFGSVACSQSVLFVFIYQHFIYFIIFYYDIFHRIER